MIYTCTLNPSIDYKIQTKQFELGTLHRPDNTAFYPGGKGINVSRVLRNLGINSTALGFIGGFTGGFIQESLNNEGIHSEFVMHDEPTRINVKIKTDNEETEINGSGAYISKEYQDQLLEKVTKLKSSDFLVLSGSLPSSISFSFYEKLSSICNDNEVALILDIPDCSLKRLLKFRPFLIKPNQSEISEMLGIEIKTKQDAIDGAKKLNRLGAENVIVSMGDEGAVFVNSNLISKATIPEGTLISSVGAGDSMVAGFLSSYLKEFDLIKAFQYGVASGSATAFSDDLCKKDQVDQLLSQVTVNNNKEAK